MRGSTRTCRKGSLQRELGRRIIPVFYVGHEVPCKGGADVRFNGMLKLPGNFAHGVAYVWSSEVTTVSIILAENAYDFALDLHVGRRYNNGRHVHVGRLQANLPPGSR